MVKIYGASDDLVEIEGSQYEFDEIGCYGADVRITFTDGTIILVGYAKADLDAWWIKVEKTGTAEQRLVECLDDTDDPYSDVFFIRAEVLTHEVIEKC